MTARGIVWGVQWMRAVALGLVVIGLGGCGEPYLSAPRNPGTVRAVIKDDVGAAVPAARVQVQMPNNAGSFYEVTTSSRTDGTAEISSVPAGQRRVTVQPPAGYLAGEDPLTKVVLVVKGEIVIANFVVRRVAIP